MGVTVLHIFPDEVRSGFKAVEYLCQRIFNLGASSHENFTVDCESYYTNAGGGAGGPVSKKLHILHNSNNPVTTYAIIEAGTKQILLSADLMFDLLLPRLSHMYTVKKNLKIESKGKRYTVGDFVVKIGTVTMSSGQYKGILVEVEYLPCVFPDQCWPLLKEFMQSLMGCSAPTDKPKYFQKVAPQIQFTPQDTIQQYLEKFNELRETVHVQTV